MISDGKDPIHIGYYKQKIDAAFARYFAEIKYKYDYSFQKKSAHNYIINNLLERKVYHPNL